MNRAFEWQKVKQKYRLEGEDWPECLTSEIIAYLHYPNNKGDSGILKGMLDDAVDTGVIGFDAIAIAAPRRLLVSFSIDGGRTPHDYSKYRPNLSYHEWLTFLEEFEINVPRYASVNNAPFGIVLKERFNDGRPKSWYLQHRFHEQEQHVFKAIPLISKSAYAAWIGNSELPIDSPLKYWLDIGDTPNQQPELIPDTGEGLPAKKQEREITTWLRETWINEGKPDGGEFFTRLKKYVNQSKSPIREHWTTSPKAAGLRFCTGSHSGELSKKTISNKVSLFKSQVSKKACQ